MYSQVSLDYSDTEETLMILRQVLELLGALFFYNFEADLWKFILNGHQRHTESKNMCIVSVYLDLTELRLKLQQSGTDSVKVP